VFDRHVHAHGAGAGLPYRLASPPSVKPRSRHPVVLFLHGAGERGADNEAQLQEGIAELTTPDIRSRFPCFICAPQCPADVKWVDTDWELPSHTMAEEPTEPMRLVLELVQELAQDKRVDPQRLYLMGLSMGGFGAWEALMRRPNLFAAAVIYCGGADVNLLERVSHVPVWLIHSRGDTVVLVSRSRDVVSRIGISGGHLRYTEIGTDNHDCWSGRFADPDLLKWLFAKRRRRSP
jgi:predicted peptidase